MQLVDDWLDEMVSDPFVELPLSRYPSFFGPWSGEFFMRVSNNPHIRFAFWERTVLRIPLWVELDSAMVGPAVQSQASLVWFRGSS